MKHLTNCNIASLDSTYVTANNPYGLIEHASLIIDDTGYIVWVGPTQLLPEAYRTIESQDQNGLWITPALIDCHTHVVFAGDRYHEFEARLNGVSYETIAEQGGGILSTVRATREATQEQLFAQSLPRLQALINEGVRTVEIKSGYGLDFESERKMLRVAKALEAYTGIRIKTTCLAAHALPPEFKNRADDYIDTICQDWLPRLCDEGLVDAVDVFCERIGFSAAQSERLFQAAQHLNVRVKIHAEQLSNQGGAALAARYNALSADHLEYLSPEGIAAMKASNTVAVILPAAFYFLRETKLPPIEALRAAGVPMAVSTDCNPGTAPITSLLTTLNMATVLFKMTPAEALLGATTHAAQALGLAHEIGSIAVGKRAELVKWHIKHPRDLVCGIQSSLCAGAV